MIMTDANLVSTTESIDNGKKFHLHMLIELSEPHGVHDNFFDIFFFMSKRISRFH